MRLTGKFALNHVNVIPGDERPAISDCCVVIEGNRISAIQSASVATDTIDASIVDCRGAFLIPGLWDMHTHATLYGEKCLSELLAYGVTGIRDMGGLSDVIKEWRKSIDCGERLGPAIYSAGPFIDGPKKMRPDRARATITVETAEEARLATRQVCSQGADFVKVHSRLNKPAFQALVSEASLNGLGVAVHLPVGSTVEDVIELRILSLEHAESFLESSLYALEEAERETLVDGRFQELTSPQGDALFQRFADAGIWLTPTLVALSVVFENNGSALERSLPARLTELTGRVHRNRVRLLAGTDFAWEEVGIRPGLHLHRELALLVNAGLTAPEALSCATSNAAECLGIADDHGTVDAGKIADLVVLEDDPHADIANLGSIMAVVRNGHYLERIELAPLLGDDHIGALD